ncbi:MAG: cyanophycin synthetase, partial [Candidatus Omnitrophota bacterium]
AVLNKKSPMLANLAKGLSCRLLYFSDEVDNENYSAVYRIATIFRLAKTDCLKVFSSFSGMPHRMQIVRRVNGVNFINDSKATNPAATIWALKSVKKPLILIAGGKDKGMDYTTIRPYGGRIKKINLIGEASSKIREHLGGYFKAETFSSLEEAVSNAYSHAQEGETVLLSPMCASFDMFFSYIDRGRKFVSIVNRL